MTEIVSATNSGQSETRTRPLKDAGLEAVQPREDLTPQVRDLRGSDTRMAELLRHPAAKDIGAHLDPFRLNSWIGGRELPELDECLQGFRMASFESEPPRGEWHVEDHAGKYRSGNHLEEKRQTKAPIRHDEACAICDIESNDLCNQWTFERRRWSRGRTQPRTTIQLSNTSIAPRR